jgi:hypothetical protein
MATILGELFDQVEAVQTKERHQLFGNIHIVTSNRETVYACWGLDGAQRSGKSVARRKIAYLYNNLRVPNFGIDRFKIVSIDLPTREGTNLCEPAFCSLPFLSNHPLYSKTMKQYGQAVQIPIEVYRPLVFTEGEPLGLGVSNTIESIPSCVKPYTINFYRLNRKDWETLLGSLSRTAKNLIDTALRRMGTESSIQDLIHSVEVLAMEKNISYLPDISILPKDTPELPLSIRSFDKKSVPGLLSRLETLASAGFLLPEQIGGSKVETNINIHKVLDDMNTWTVFNFPPSIPAEISFGIIRYIIRQILHSPINLVVDIPEISQFAPNSITEEDSWFIRPMRDLLRILCTQHAKTGKIVLADFQNPKQVDSIVYGAFRYRLHFVRNEVELIEEIKNRGGLINKNELLASLPLVLDEVNRKGYCVFIPPGDRGYIIPGTAVPPFRTHVTDEGDFDSVFYDTYGSKSMSDPKPTYDYVAQILYQVHCRVRQQQDEFIRKERLQEFRKKSKGLVLILNATTKLMTETHQTSFLKRDWKETMQTRCNLYPNAVEYQLKIMLADSIAFIDKREPRKHMVNFNYDKLNAKLEELQSLDEE